MSRRNVVEQIAVRIAGEIIVADRPGEAIKKWREIFRISQTQLASKLNTSPSVISDYESGRRKFPGARFIRKLVYALIEIDMERGGLVVDAIARQITDNLLWLAVLDMKDFSKPVDLHKFSEMLSGEIVVEGSPHTLIYGYTVVDSIRLVLDVPAHEYFKLYGSTSQRAAIFTNVSTGRSPLVAIKSMMAITPLKPSAVVLHGIKNVDVLAIEIAKRERLPLLTTVLPLKDVLNRLQSDARYAYP